MISTEDAKLIATPNLPLGHLGISHAMYHLFEANLGDLVSFQAGGMSRFYMVWPNRRDMERATRFSNHWLMLNENTSVVFDAHINDLSDTQERMFWLDINHQIAPVCISDSMTNSREVRMNDTTRALLELSWNDIIPVGEENFTVKPILRGDANQLSLYPALQYSVFIREDDLPDGWTAIKLPQKGSNDPFGDQHNQALTIVKNLLGKELAKDVEADIFNKATKSYARIYYKAWAKGVATSKDPAEAVSQAIRTMFRDELVKTRDRINETIDRIPKE